MRMLRARRSEIIFSWAAIILLMFGLVLLVGNLGYPLFLFSCGTCCFFSRPQFFLYFGWLSVSGRVGLSLGMEMKMCGCLQCFCSYLHGHLFLISLSIESPRHEL